MNKGLFSIVMVVLLVVGCADGKRSTTSETDDDSGDTLATEVNDDGWLPKAAEDLFDDFFYNFATNSRLQVNRINFPLPVADGRKRSKIESTEWKMDSFYMDKGEMTLLFDNAEQMELVRDTTVSEAIVEKIFLEQDTVVQYLFSRATGRWMLNSIRRQQIADNPNASFLRFYRQFATDSVYQHQSLSEEIAFSGPDPDDDFENMEGVITPDFWDAFAPELPSGTIYNVVYGSTRGASDEKIFVIRRLEGDEEVDITFVRERNQWKLTKLTE